MDTCTPATVPSILDKPLKQLTEEDISQLTREDCRKFLRDKGMRRPSWNKSQAIQQVISLKALLEGSDDSGTTTLRKVMVSPMPENPSLRVTSNSDDSFKELNSNAGISVSTDEMVQSQSKDPPISTPEELSFRAAADVENKGITPSSPCATNGSAGQMAIFYCGKVNVYDEMPPDKARAILHLAANPIYFPEDDRDNGTTPVWYFPCHSGTAHDRYGPIPANIAISQTMQTEKISECPQQDSNKGIINRLPDVEGQASRKVSLQRYFEKRKDRGRFKNRKDAGSNPSTLEMYMNHQMRTPSSNGQLSRSSTSSPTQSGLRNALCCSTNNRGKVINLSVGPNDKGTLRMSKNVEFEDTS